MENASKALFIAAGVIIALMVLSIGVYLFVTFGQAAKNTYDQVEESQINQFNSQFTTYLDRTDLTIYDVITVANLATQNNINNEIQDTSTRGQDVNNYYIAVTLNDKKIGLGNTEKKIEFAYNEKSAKDIEKFNNDLIGDHMQKMIDLSYFIKVNHVKADGTSYVEDSNNCMPRIKCTNVEISKITRKSI